MNAATLLIVQLLLGYGLASLAFLFGFRLGAWQFPVTLAAVLAFAFWRSRKLGWRVLGLNALVLFLTLFTFTYIHCDASTCHLPMARFMENGWNPVRETTLESLAPHWAAYGITAAEDRLIAFHSFHLIADPKFVQVLAAQVQAATGLFTAAGYPLWALFFALAWASVRVVREVLGASTRAGALLAALLCCNIELTYGSFRGQVDFVTYAATATAALALVLWHRGKRRGDLVLFFACLVIAAVSKFNGLLTTLLLLAFGAFIGRKERDMRRGLALFAGAFLILGILPYGTATWWFGSPFYPAHTFRSDVVLPELTGDFDECNADAARMGRLARLVYAYVSQPLAVWGSRLWHGESAFTPEWNKTWLTCGYGFWGSLPIWLGLAASFWVRDRVVKGVALILFASFFLIPTKYIGFPRYVAQVHAAAALGLFAFAVARQGRVRKGMFAALTLGALTFAGVSGWHFLGQLRLEGVVQRNVAHMKRAAEPYALRTDNPKVLHQETWAYVLRDRLGFEGVPIGIDAPGRTLEMGFQMVMEGPGILSVYDTGPFSFPFPHPVFRASSKTRGTDF